MHYNLASILSIVVMHLNMVKSNISFSKSIKTCLSKNQIVNSHYWRRKGAIRSNSTLLHSSAMSLVSFFSFAKSYLKFLWSNTLTNAIYVDENHFEMMQFFYFQLLLIVFFMFPSNFSLYFFLYGIHPQSKMKKLRWSINEGEYEIKHAHNEVRIR